MTNTNILVVGVGGQGTLLASRILGALFIKRGSDVKLSEVHGMAQRGGSVVTYVKAGEKISSPLLCKHEADIIISFEKLEGLRWKDYLKDDGMLILNTQEILPMPVITGKAGYPENIEETLTGEGIRLVAFDALTLAESLGNVKAVNTIMLGVTSNYMDFSDEEWEDAIKKFVKPKFVDLNIKAFHEGKKLKKEA